MPWHPTLINSQILSVHAALLPVGPKGTVVMLGGSEHNQDQGGTDDNPAVYENIDRTALFDVNTRADAVKISSPRTDVFCAGHAFLSDGRLLIGGGTESWGGEPAGGPGGGHVHWHGNFGGHRACWIYNQERQYWQRTADFRFDTGPGKGGGRWYPSIITLPSGDLAAFGGHPSRHSADWHENDLPERYSSAGGFWSWYPNAFGFDFSGIVPGNWYPRVSLVTGGNLFFTSKTGNKCRFFDPDSGALVDPEIDPPGSPYESSWDYAVISLPFLPGDGYRTRVMTVGGAEPLVIELNPPSEASTPEWAPAGTRQGDAAGKARNFVCPVYLPTGDIFVSGGIDGRDDADAVKKPEVFTPNINWATRNYQSGGIGSWQTLNEEAQIARNYHSVALLLPDGSVFTAGSNIDGGPGDPATVGQRNIELYFPDYFSNPARPSIASAPSVITYADRTLTFSMGSAAEASAVEKVALIRCGSVTHAGDFDQRYVALAFDVEDGSAQVSANLPQDPSVLPPGYYMLWAVNASGLPCSVAPFVRMAHASCQVVIDRDKFSEEEVQSFSGDALFPSVLYPMFDGFLPGELPASPQVTVRWQESGEVVPSSQIRLTAAGSRWLEHPSEWEEVAQRVTYPYSIEIRDPAIFNGITDKRTFRVSFEALGHSCIADIDLVKTPNPYMIDVDPVVRNRHWLSTDIRTFRVRAGEMRYADIPAHGTGDAAAEAFAKALIDKFRDLPNDETHPFLDLPREGDAAAVDLAPTDAGAEVYNYAVAKVRYRATTTNAQNVKVFFRLCTTLETGLHYDPNGVYKHSGPGASTVPLLGVVGNEVISIPFFLSPRVETVNEEPGATSMANQPLIANYEVQTITPTVGQEVTAYFACWLDINRPEVKRFPLAPGSSEGPWPESACLPIQAFVRSPHQCMVAEVYYEPDATDPGDTPATSDNISQRNLAILHAENPGSDGGRHVVHPFEIRSSAFGFAVNAEVNAPAFYKTLPDELLIDWGTLPRDSEVTLYFSNVDTADILTLATTMRYSAAPFAVIDNHTIQMRVGQGSWLPVPAGQEPAIPVLLSAQLPPTITAGEAYRIAIHQVRGHKRLIVGSVEIHVPATKAPLMIDREVKTLSIMKYIKTTIPSTNRWWPIFQRYIAFLEGRVAGLGVDPKTVHPNPDGSGAPRDTTSGVGGITPDKALEKLARTLKHCCRQMAYGLIGLGLLLLLLLLLLILRG